MSTDLPMGRLRPTQVEAKITRLEDTIASLEAHLDEARRTVTALREELARDR